MWLVHVFAGVYKVGKNYFGTPSVCAEVIFFKEADLISMNLLVEFKK